MSKYKESNYLQLYRSIFKNQQFLSLSVNAKWLYVVLNELEQRYTNSQRTLDWFFRMDKDLALDCGFNLRTLQRAKRELRDIGVVQIGLMHWIDPKTKRKSEKHATTYKLCDI